jgi:uncharacterized membrane protein
MAKTDGIFIYIGTYPDEAAAHVDYESVKAVLAEGELATYDAAVIIKDEHGKVHVNKDETTTRRGGWGGVAAGALVGIIFPPSIIATTLIGGAIGGIGGHLWRGMSRGDIKELGDLIDGNQAALLIIGKSIIEDAVSKASLKPEKHVSKELTASAESLGKAIQEAAEEVS